MSLIASLAGADLTRTFTFQSFSFTDLKAFTACWSKYAASSSFEDAHRFFPSTYSAAFFPVIFSIVFRSVGVIFKSFITVAIGNFRVNAFPVDASACPARGTTAQSVPQMAASVPVGSLPSLAAVNLPISSTHCVAHLAHSSNPFAPVFITPPGNATVEASCAPTSPTFAPVESGSYAPYFLTAQETHSAALFTNPASSTPCLYHSTGENGERMAEPSQDATVAIPATDLGTSSINPPTVF